MGKTSLAVRFPGPLTCISIRETGFDDLNDVGIVPPGCTNYNIPDYQYLIPLLKECTAQTIVIDSLSGFQQVFFEHIIKTQYDGNRTKFSAYSTGARQDAPIIMLDLEAVLTEKRNKGQHVILIAHTRVDTITNALGANYESSSPDLDKGIRANFTKWAQAVLYIDLNSTISIATEMVWTGGKQVAIEGKADRSDGPTRIMYTEKGLGHSAKNRLGLPSMINMGKSAQEAFDNLWKHIPQVYKEPT